MAKGHARPRGNNKWQLEVDLGKKLYGKGRNRKYKTITADSQKEADLELAKFVVDVTGTNYFEPEKTNFVDFINNEWFPKCGSKRLSHTTLATHVEYLEARILPAFQYFRLDEIKPMHINDFIDNLGEDGMRLDGKEGKLSSSTIFYHYRILKNVFNYAMEIRFLKESPLDGVRKPPVEYEEVDPYDFDESIDLFQALETELLHWQITIKLAISKGMRRSELYGLDLLKHVDLDRKVVKVRQALTYTKDGGFQIHEIKKGSRRAKKRDIALMDSLVEPIRQLILLRKKERMEHRKELWEDGKHFLLLCHPNGEPYNPSSMRNWWVRFIDRHELRYINIHALRHTMVNLLIELGTPLSSISKRAGHSGIGITNDTYGHRIQNVDELASTKLDNLLNNKTQDKTLETIEK